MKKKTTKKKVTKKKTKKRQRSIIINEIKPDQILLRDRTILLFDPIDTKLAKDIISKVTALDILGKEPILLKINSGGGSILDGIAIADTMRMSRCPIVTYITGYACSMAGMLSIQGNTRIMSKDSIWMAHPARGGVSPDYFPFQKDRMKFIELLDAYGDEVFRKYTKLSPKERMKAKHGELWLNAEQALAKGIVDKII